MAMASTVYGLHKLKCLKQATGKVDQWMLESVLNAWSATGHDAGMSCHFCSFDHRRSNRRLSCEKLLASGRENVTDGTLTELPFQNMAWSNQLHILIPPRVILALAPVVTQSGAFLMRQICSLRWSFWASFDYRFDRSAKATNSVRKMMQLALNCTIIATVACHSSSVLELLTPQYSSK